MTKPAREAADPRAVAAARNNAEWCDLVCRTHGLVPAFHADAWVTATRSPVGYPDAVTLSGSATADLLARIDCSLGCSVKDSFAALDLSGSGFEVLFDAEWIYRSPTVPADDGRLSWAAVRTEDELEAWASAHGGGAVFRPALLDNPAVVVLAATDENGSLAAGVVGNRSETVVGLSNMFTVSAEVAEAWAGAVAALADAFPAIPVVGYEHGVDLAAAHGAGFISVGDLRVWLKD